MPITKAKSGGYRLNGGKVYGTRREALVAEGNAARDKARAEWQKAADKAEAKLAR